MGAMARQQRRLLGVGGSRMSLAGVRGHHLRRQRHLRRAAAGRPGRRHAVRDAALRRRSARRPPSPGGRWPSPGCSRRSRWSRWWRSGRWCPAPGFAVVSAPSACSAARCRWRSCCCRCAARDRGGCSRSWARGWSRACRRSAASRRATPRRSSQEQLEEVTALEPDRPTLWIAALPRGAELAGRRRVPGVRDPGRRRRRAVGGAAARVGGGHGGGVAGADPGRARGRRGDAELGADRDGAGRVDGDRGGAGLPDREPVAGARGGRAHAAGARRPEADGPRRVRRPGRPGARPASARGGPPSGGRRRAGARCRRAAAGRACP